MTRPIDDARLCELGRAVIDTEAQAVAALRPRIDGRFAKACGHMLACGGRIVVTGMGKSGHVGGKIAATLASTGTPAFFVHPGEASHGDLGLVTAKDVVLALSNSGETEELLTILPIIKRLRVPLIAMTGKVQSRLALAADVTLDVSVEKEACPLGLAPTSSTTVTLAMGDALAVALLEARGFTAEDFALSHPAGSLGRRLLLRIDDLMHTGAAIPQVRETASVSAALKEMTSKGLGMTVIVDDRDRMTGIFTDGDLRRLLDHGEVNIQKLGIAEVMKRSCTCVAPGILAAEALQIMDSKRINALPVLDTEGRLVGALNMHDLLRAGVV
jgi:arabinose-5-phosphate isomerase